MTGVCRTFSGAKILCPEPHCRRKFKSDPQSDEIPSPPPSPGPDPPPSPPPKQIVPPSRDGTNIEYHPIVDGTPCDINGYLPPSALLPPWEERAADNFSPFNSHTEFEFANFLYHDEGMAGRQVDCLAKLLAALYQGTDPPTIDVIQQGDVPWQSFSITYTGPLPELGDVPVWMMEKYEVWFCSLLGIFEKQLANPDLKDEMDWAPKRIFKDGKCQYVDLFSGNWMWEQADKIAEDKNTHGAMFIPSVLGSDKTTVSVGTGNTKFYPFYGGIGNIYNSMRVHASIV
ncbi:hypothetical protein B0H10DRAFT_1954922 [Mycena sp. CBHHK59/15]|nr:hypothetical protein B0H10DRAFT_1954922 [Mycena sp. CBHHK59/15]